MNTMKAILLSAPCLLAGCAAASADDLDDWPVAPHDIEQIQTAAAPAVAYIGTNGCNFDPHPSKICDVAAGDSAALAACLAAGYRHVRAAAGVYEIDSTLEIGSHTILEKQFDGTSSVIYIMPSPSFDMSRPVMMAIDHRRSVQIRGELVLDGFTPHVSSTNLESGIVISTSTEISVSGTMLPRYTGGNAVHVIESKCVSLGGLTIEEIQTAMAPGEDCSDIQTDGGAVRVERSRRIGLSGIRARAVARSGIIAVESTDISIFRADLGDIAPPGNCEGYGVGIGIDLVPDVSGQPGVPLYINNVVTPLPIHGAGVYVETSGVGNTGVHLEGAHVNLDPIGAPLVWDGFYLCSASMPQPAYMDVMGSSTDQGDIRSTILPLPSAGTNSCGGGACTYPGYSCGAAPNFWW